MAINYSSLLVSDLDQIMTLEPLLFDHPFSRETYHYEISHNPLAHYYKLSLEDEIIGYGGIQTILDEAHLMTIGIKKAYQKQGLGKILLRQLIKEAKELGCQCMILEVNVNNHGALHLYQDMGFKTTRTRPHYYGKDNAYEMRLDWSEQQ